MSALGRMLLVGAAVVVWAVACSNETEQLTANLNDCRGQLESLSSDNEKLRTQYSVLISQHEQLLAEVDNLKVKQDELKAWSRRLADQFGPSIWYFGKDEKPLPVESLPGATPAQLVAQLNRRLHGEGLPEVVLDRVEGDTAFVRIHDETQLTQNMGTTGATGFIESVVYTLTSLPTIHAVDFNFQAGDHAMPGRYSR